MPRRTRSVLPPAPADEELPIGVSASASLSESPDAPYSLSPSPEGPEPTSTALSIARNQNMRDGLRGPPTNRPFTWVEEKFRRDNEIELVRHSFVDLRMSYSSSCSHCRMILEVLRTFPQFKNIVTRGSHRKRHHEYLEIFGADRNDVYEYKLPNTEHAYVIRNSITKWFFLAKPFKPLRHQAAFAKRFDGKELPWGALIGYSLGSGKSHTALHTLRLHNRNKITIVCAISLMEQWVETVSEQSNAPGSSPLHVHIVGYDRFTALVHAVPEHQWGKFLKGRAAVVDEAHFYKNQLPSMQASLKALMSADTVFCLTGTPMRNDVGDIGVFLKFLDLPELIPESLDDFEEKSTSLFRTAEEMREERNIYSDPRLLKKILLAASDGRVAMYNPKWSLDKKVYRRRYPAVENSIIKHEITWHQAVHISLFGSGVQVRIRGKNRAIGHRGGTLTRLSMLSGVSDMFDGSIHSSKCEAILSDVKKMQTERKLNGHPEWPVVCFSKFKAKLLKPLLKVFQDYLESKGLKRNRAALMTGDTPITERNALLERYNRSDLCFLAFCQVGAEGLDLTRVSSAMYLIEPLWNKAAEDQVFGRVVRYQGKVLPPGSPPIHLVRCVSQWPTREPNAAERSYIEDLVYNNTSIRRAFGFTEAGGVDADAVIEFCKKSMSKREGKTEEEHMAESNIVKTERILPLMAVLWGCSVMTATAANPVPKELPPYWRAELQRALGLPTDAETKAALKAEKEAEKEEKRRAKAERKAAERAAKGKKKRRPKASAKEREKLREEKRKAETPAQREKRLARNAKRREKYRKRKREAGEEEQKEEVEVEEKKKKKKKKKKTKRRKSKKQKVK